MTQSEIRKRSRELKREISALQKILDRLRREEEGTMARLEKEMSEKVAPIARQLLKLGEEQKKLQHVVCKNDLHRLSRYERESHFKCPDCGYEHYPEINHDDEAHP